MEIDINESWVHIYDILAKHKYPSFEEGVMINFNQTNCDYKAILCKIILDILYVLNRKGQIASFIDQRYISSDQLY